MAKNADNMGPARGLAPHLTVKDGRAAIAFYKAAFGAKSHVTVPAEDGARIMHAYLTIDGDPLMLADDFPEYRDGKASPPPASVTLHLQVKNADKAFDRAVKAGAKVKMALADMFWGDRYGQVLDPFGHTWAIGAALKGAARKAALASTPSAPPPPAKKAAKKAAKKKKA